MVVTVVRDPLDRSLQIRGAVDLLDSIGEMPIGSMEYSHRTPSLSHVPALAVAKDLNM